VLDALYTAASGMLAQQTNMDVIGNNLANANTGGYRSSAARFSDQFSATLRYASAPGTGFGGVNPMQVGGGVRLADIARSFQQGALRTTGRPLDVALQGQGFFALSNGARTVYTRVGTFGLDGASNLVDQRTGFNVLDAGANLVVTADVPGLGDKDLEVTFHDNVLTVSGERKAPAPEGYAVHRRERPELQFARSVALPVKIDVEKTSATVKDGVLTITLAKAPEVRPRQIAVRASS